MLALLSADCARGATLESIERRAVRYLDVCDLIEFAAAGLCDIALRVFIGPRTEDRALRVLCALGAGDAALGVVLPLSDPA